jgi:hypothetical protein
MERQPATSGTAPAARPVEALWPWRNETQFDLTDRTRPSSMVLKLRF